MTTPLTIRPRGRRAAPAPGITIDPAAGRTIKQEDATWVWRQDLPDAGAAVLKLYRHRGPPLPEFLGLTDYRAAREHRALHFLHREGCPCSEPLFWARGRHPDHGFYELLATRDLAQATTLRGILRDTPAADPDLRPLFTLVAAMHRKGLHHGSLLPRNILVSLGDGTATYHIIDLPRALIFPRSIVGTRMARHDLATLCQGLAPLVDAERLAGALAAYGLAAEDARAFLDNVSRHPLSNRARNRQHAEFAFRCALATVLAALLGL